MWGAFIPRCAPGNQLTNNFLGDGLVSGRDPGTSSEGMQMKFVDELLAKFKKVDDSDRDRLRTVRSHLPEPEHEVEANVCENTSLGSIKAARSGPSKSITRLRAFVKQKSVEEMAAEDAQRRKAQEEFTSNALNDIEQHGL